MANKKSVPGYHCDNCGCDRYKTCTCMRTAKKMAAKAEAKPAVEEAPAT